MVPVGGRFGGLVAWRFGGLVGGQVSSLVVSRIGGLPVGGLVSGRVGGLAVRWPDGLACCFFCLFYFGLNFPTTLSSWWLDRWCLRWGGGVESPMRSKSSTKEAGRFL